MRLGRRLPFATSPNGSESIPRPAVQARQRRTFGEAVGLAWEAKRVVRWCKSGRFVAEQLEFRF